MNNEAPQATPNTNTGGRRRVRLTILLSTPSLPMALILTQPP